MAQTKDETVNVTKFNDHEVIVPPNRLKKAVRHVTAGDVDPLAGAEEALEQLSGEFATWMNDECGRLEEARQRVHANGLTEADRQSLFRAAHDIKGHAATFGFPMAADVADSLCRVIDHAADPSQIPLAFIDQCVDSVRAIIREHADVDAERTAEELATELRAIAGEYLRVKGDGADATESSPPLAPG